MSASGLIDAMPIPTARNGRKKKPSKKSYLKEASPIFPNEVYSPARRKRIPPSFPRNSSAICPSGFVSLGFVYLGNEETPGVKTRATCPRSSCGRGSGARRGATVVGYAQFAGCACCVYAGAVCWAYVRGAGLGAGGGA